MRKNKGLVLLTLVALAAFTITATIGGSASASGGNAVAAKKKCKKKKVSSAKKKKCKKKKKTTPVAPISMVRATLTWSGGGDSTDYNLYVFDSSGNTGRAGSDPIANTSFSPNAVGSSRTETFTDLDFGQHRAFDFGVCKQDGGTDGSSYTIDYVTADGIHHTDAQSSHDDGYAARYSDSLPPNAPNGFAPCPIP